MFAPCVCVCVCVRARARTKEIISTSTSHQFFFAWIPDIITMEQLSSMFTRLKRNVGAGGDCSQPPQKQVMSADTTTNTRTVSVIEEDGFLVIGEHESNSNSTGVYASTFERSTVQTQGQTNNQVNLFRYF